MHIGGTDSPLTPQQLSENKLVQIPMVVGGLVPVVNLPGLGANQMVLSGEVLADIMRGDIQRWDDPRVAAKLDTDSQAEAREQLAMLDGAGHAFDLAAVRAGRQTPVYFGSAVNNFGIPGPALFTVASSAVSAACTCFKSPSPLDTCS